LGEFSEELTAEASPSYRWSNTKFAQEPELIKNNLTNLGVKIQVQGNL